MQARGRHADPRAFLGSGENEVFHFTAAKILCVALAQEPANGIDDVDFPDPFGPTIATMPAGNSKTVLLANDLKPLSSSRFRK